MKIVLLTEFFPGETGRIFTGGVEARVYYLSNYLSSQGYKVKVDSRTGEYAVNSVRALIDRLLYFIFQLIKIGVGKVEKVDIIEGTNFTTYIPAYLWARKVGAKAISWWPDVWGKKAINNTGWVNGLIVYLTEKIALKLKWDGIIALSEETKRKLVKSGADRKKIKVIYGGADSQKYKKVQKSTLLREAMAGQAKKYKKPTIICISRLVEYKRIKDLVLAVYLLKHKFPNIKLLVVGEGAEKENLKFEIRNLKLEKQVEMLGRISEEDKWEYLRRSWIHVLPSVVEGFGLATVESLSVGTPVVNADIPINREILAGEKGGLLFYSKDYVDLAEKIEMLLSDKKLYNQKVEEGKELVKKYDWEKVNREAEEFYKASITEK